MKNNDFLGRHSIIELYQCNSSKINEEKIIEEILNEAVKIGNLHIIKSFFHKFGENKISGVFITEESHILIHSWPEYEYITMDIFACGKNIKIEDILLYVALRFEAKRYSAHEIQKGNINELVNYKK